LPRRLLGSPRYIKRERGRGKRERGREGEREREREREIESYICTRKVTHTLYTWYSIVRKRYSTPLVPDELT
jgi:hypothetical protein